MASYFTARNTFDDDESHKPQIRQQGFHLPSPALSSTTPPPAHHQQHNMDFSDELVASLISSPPAQERTSTPHSPPDDHYSDEARYRPPAHTIFDISAPSQQHHAHFRSDPIQEQYQQQHYNSLGSSLRYEPEPSYHQQQQHQHQQHQHQHQHQQQQHHHHHAHAHHQQQFRQTPSPIDTSRSRSRSRGPSVPPTQPNASTQSTVGPTRNVRQRRGHSMSSSSPPRPQAILIPGSQRANQHQQLHHHQHQNHHTPSSPLSLTSMSSSTGAWFIPSHQSPTDYLPTPDSLNSHTLATHGQIMHQQQHHSHYAAFGLSPPDSNPSSSLHHSLAQSQSAVPRTAIAGAPVMANGPHHHHHHQHQQQQQQHSPTLPHSIPSTPSAPPPTSGLSPNEKQAFLANEKKRRRRESHNAVERRRRDNINEKISELATLIPECMLDPNGGGLPAVAPASTSPVPIGVTGIEDDPLLAGLGAAAESGLTMLPSPTSPTLAGSPIQTKREPDDPSALANTGPTAVEIGVVKANKGMILRKSVEYIRYLQQIVQAQASRNRELEGLLSRTDPPSLSLAIGAETAVLGRAAGKQMHTPTDSGRDSPPSRTRTRVVDDDEQEHEEEHEEDTAMPVEDDRAGSSPGLLFPLAEHEGMEGVLEGGGEGYGVYRQGRYPSQGQYERGRRGRARGVEA